jgi:hypothetical protein
LWIFFVDKPILYCRIHSREREASVFEVGDKVIVNSYTTPKEGVIVKWYYDEGNVWVVRVQDQTISTFCDSELTPA